MIYETKKFFNIIGGNGNLEAKILRWEGGASTVRLLDQEDKIGLDVSAKSIDFFNLKRYKNLKKFSADETPPKVKKKF